jgi:hypothetical protein
MPDAQANRARNVPNGSSDRTMKNKRKAKRPGTKGSGGTTSRKQTTKKKTSKKSKRK